MNTYPIAPHGIFHTIQGEGVLIGKPMVFIRLAGCPVGCPECDTNYSIADKLSARDIALKCSEICGKTSWVWLTGGEPTTHDLPPLVEELRKYGFRIALATAGINPIVTGFSKSTGSVGGVEFVSVSPHRIDDSWVVRRGDQLNLVPGLNSLRLTDLIGLDLSGFAHKFVTPLWYTPADKMEKISECVEWVNTHQDWKLGIQAHKIWGLA